MPIISNPENNLNFQIWFIYSFYLELDGLKPKDQMNQSKWINQN